VNFTDRSGTWNRMIFRQPGLPLSSSCFSISVIGFTMIKIILIDEIFSDSRARTISKTILLKANNKNKKIIAFYSSNFFLVYLGVSAFISLPHFMNAEEKFIQDVQGIRLRKLNDLTIFNLCIIEKPSHI